MTSVKETSVCFVLLLCVFLQGSLVTSIPRSFSNTDANIAPFIPTNFGEPVNKSNSGVCSSLVEYFRYAIDSRHELLLIGNGSHFLVPLSEKAELEQEYKTIAIAVSKLLRNLKSMERTHMLIMDITETLFYDFIIPQAENVTSPGEFMGTILRLYIEGIDKKFLTDKELAVEYKKQKSIAREFVKCDPKMHEPLMRMGDDCKLNYNEDQHQAFLQDKNVFLESVANELFLRRAFDKFAMLFLNSTRQKHYLLARALIQKARSAEYESKVNEVYAKALVQTRPYVRAERVDYAVIDDVLFNSIEAGLASDPTLQKEIEALMKQRLKIIS